MRLVGDINRPMERFIHVIFAESSAGVRAVICLQYLQKIRASDIWFLLVISKVGNAGAHLLPEAGATQEWTL